MVHSSIKQRHKKIGTRFEVYSGIAKETRGGLTKQELTKRDGIIYSKTEYKIKKEKDIKEKQKIKDKIKKAKLQIQEQIVQKPKRPRIKPSKQKLSWADVMN